jgi:hypothetical protein
VEVQSVLPVPANKAQAVIDLVMDLQRPQQTEVQGYAFSRPFGSLGRIGGGVLSATEATVTNCKPITTAKGQTDQLCDADTIISPD